MGRKEELDLLDMYEVEGDEYRHPRRAQEAPSETSYAEVDEATGEVVLRETWRGVDKGFVEFAETQMFALLVRGVDEEEIMRRYGVSRDLLHRAIGNVTKRRRATAVEEHRAILDAAYAELQDALWEPAKRGVRAPLDGVLRILEGRRALNGADMPKRAEIKVSVREEVESAFTALEAVLIEAEPDDVQDAVVIEPLELERGSE